MCENMHTHKHIPHINMKRKKTKKKPKEELDNKDQIQL